jgi:hypothetical protein
MKIKSVKSAKNKLDKLWREDKKDYCEVCQTLPKNERVVANRIDPHHVIGRKNMRLRFDPRNRVSLCYLHHVGASKSAHNDPAWFLSWFEEHRPEDYKYVMKVKNEIVKYKLNDLLEMIHE